MKDDKKEFSVLKKLSPYIPLKNFIIILLGIAPVSMLLSYLQPLVLKVLTDQGIVDRDLRVLTISTAVLLGVSILANLMDFLQSKLFADVYNETFSRLFDAAYKKILRLRMTYFEEHSQTEIINTIQADVTGIASISNSATNTFLSTGLRIVSGLIGLIVISWPLAIGVLVLVPLQWFFSKFMATRKEKIMEQSLDCGRKFYAWLGDDFSGIQEIKLWGLASSKIKQLANKLNTVLSYSKANTILDSRKFFIDGSFNSFIICLIYVLGGILVIDQKFTIGKLLAFIQYMGYVISPLTYLFGIKYNFSAIMPSAKRYFNFLDLEEESCGEKMISQGECNYNFQIQNVSFCYPGKERVVLKNINLQIADGEKIAIIGDNGSGKSTLLKLLLRLAEPIEGTIKLNGVPIEEFDIESYRALFSVVGQTTHLFWGTIADNITLGQDVSEKVMVSALEKSGALDFVSRLPAQLESYIGINGTQLSGGERQKLNVTRALVRTSPIVVLDEATSAFDVQSITHLNDMLNTEFNDKTILVITHQPELLQYMNRVYRLVDGELFPA